jgi:hypothetical protein
MGVYAGGCGPVAPLQQTCNVGPAHGGFTTTGVILVLFILLVIIACAGIF